MPIEVNSNGYFLQVGQNPSIARATPEREPEPSEQQRDARITLPSSSVEATDNPIEKTQDPVRRAEAVQQLESDNLRVRRDDNSDLGFRARQAVNQFTEIKEQQRRQDVSELLGIDLFA